MSRMLELKITTKYYKLIKHFLRREHFREINFVKIPRASNEILNCFYAAMLLSARSHSGLVVLAVERNLFG